MSNTTQQGWTRWLGVEEASQRRGRPWLLHPSWVLKGVLKFSTEKGKEEHSSKHQDRSMAATAGQEILKGEAHLEAEGLAGL